MENTKNNQLNNNGDESENKEYDIFISYRNTDTSIAKVRQIAQAFELKGLKVFVDYRDKKKDPFELIKENSCRYYIVVFTYEAKETIEKFDYNSIKAEEKKKNKTNIEPGYNFAKELYLINNCFNKQVFDNKNVFYINVEEYDPDKDKYFSSKRNILDTLRERKYKSIGLPIGVDKAIRVFDIPTNNEDFESKISSLINDGWIKILNNDDNNEKNELSVGHDKASAMQCEDERFIETKKGYNNHKKLIWGLLFLLFALAATFGAIRHKTPPESNDTVIQKQDDSITIQYYKALLELYTKEFILFAGGGTVKNYIDSIYPNANVNNYPGSKYIHIPSRVAWSLLWDDGNGCDTTQYTPVLFSTTKIDIKEVDSIIFKETKRIVEYNVGTAPLKVQLLKDTLGYSKIDSITIEDLYRLLDTTNHKIHTTTSFSGTFFTYKKYLDSFGTLLDTIRRMDFNTCHDFQNEGPTILLGNDYYMNESVEKRADLKLISSDQKKPSVDLFVYTIAMVKTDEVKDQRYLKLHPRVEAFLDSIGCKQAKKDNKYWVNDNTDLIVRWD